MLNLRYVSALCALFCVMIFMLCVCMCVCWKYICRTGFKLPTSTEKLFIIHKLANDFLMFFVFMCYIQLFRWYFHLLHGSSNHMKNISFILSLLFRFHLFKVFHHWKLLFDYYDFIHKSLHCTQKTASFLYILDHFVSLILFRIE